MPELNPGSMGRRWIPEGGIQKHNEKIHRESKIADDYKNLPFKFSKPIKSKKHVIAKCKNCGYEIHVPKNTVGIICPECKKYSDVEVLS